MNRSSNPDDARNTPEHSHSLPQTEAPPPAFSCHVYVSRNADGRVTAEVANLAGISVTAADERSALRQVVDQFKQRMSEAHAAGEEIPFREPPPKPEGAAERFLAVHL